MIQDRGGAYGEAWRLGVARVASDVDRLEVPGQRPAGGGESWRIVSVAGARAGESRNCRLQGEAYVPASSEKSNTVALVFPVTPEARWCKIRIE